jgi:hypothetical protein
MQNPKDDQNSRYDDPLWCFLAEYSLSEFVADEDTEDELTAGLLSHATQDIGMPLELIQSIERTLIGFAKEAMAHFNQDSLDSPVYIRLFCQKKPIEDINSAKTSSHFNAESNAESTQINRRSDTKMNGGWGYFLIERSGVSPAGSSMSTYHLVDLYLYKEGE